MLKGGPASTNSMVSAHLGVGGVIGILTALRLWLRVETGTPYAILLLLPITGGFAWYQASEAAANAHTILRAVLLILVLVHIAAAVLHLLVWRGNVLARMWPSRN